LLRKQRDAVGLSFFSDDLELHSQTKMSSVHTRMLYSKLNQIAFTGLPLNKKSKPAELLHLISDKIHKRSLVIIFSDMFSSEEPEKLFSALQHFRHNKHEVVLFHVTDIEHEGEFKYKSRPYKFIDMESGETIKLNPNEVRDHYLNSAGLFKKNLKLKCGQYKIDFIQADVKSDFKEVLVPYLIKRSKLH